MREALVYHNKDVAGRLIETDDRKYTFIYDEKYFHDISKPSISLTMPKTKLKYDSDYLFPFFYNMLSEGVNKRLQSLTLKIDENDAFGLLLATAQSDTIGAITLGPIQKGENING